MIKKNTLWIAVVLSLTFLLSPVYADEFLDSLKEQVENEPENAYKYFALGLYFVENGNDLGLRHLITAYDMEPGSSSILFNLSDALVQFGQHKQALTYLRKYLKTYPNDVPTLTKIASTEIQIGNVKRAEKIQKNLKRIGAPKVTQDLLSLDLAQYHFSKKKYFSAERTIKPALNSSNDELASRAYSTLGSMQSIQGRFTPAIKSLDKAIKLNYKNADAYISLAYLLESQGRFNQAKGMWHLGGLYSISPEQKDYCENRMKMLAARVQQMTARGKAPPTTNPRR